MHIILYISELFLDESIHFNHRTMPFEETLITDEQLEHNDSSTRTLESSVNLNFRKKGYKYWIFKCARYLRKGNEQIF